MTKTRRCQPRCAWRVMVLDSSAQAPHQTRRRGRAGDERAAERADEVVGIGVEPGAEGHAGDAGGRRAPACGAAAQMARDDARPAASRPRAVASASAQAQSRPPGDDVDGLVVEAATARCVPPATCRPATLTPLTVSPTARRGRRRPGCDAKVAGAATCGVAQDDVVVESAADARRPGGDRPGLAHVAIAIDHLQQSRRAGSRRRVGEAFVIDGRAAHVALA